MYFTLFFKPLRSTGSHLRFWTPTLTGLNADEAVREVSERAILRHSHHTHAHTHSRPPQHPVGKSRAEQSSNAGPASTPGARANRARLGLQRTYVYECTQSLQNSEGGDAYQRGSEGTSVCKQMYS